MAKFFNSPMFQENLHTDEVYKKFLIFRKENDVWKFPYITEIKVVGLTSLDRLLSDGKVMKTTLESNGTVEEVEIPLTEDNIRCIDEGPGIFVRVPVENKNVWYPTTFSTYYTLLDRTGLHGSAMTNWEEQPKKGVFSPKRKAQFLQEALDLYKSTCKVKASVLIRDDHVEAVLSSSYGVLPMKDLVEILERQLKNDHPAYEFHKATVSQEYLKAEYLVNDTLADYNFAKYLGDGAKAGIGFVTSDIGMSEAKLYVFCQMGDRTSYFHESVGLRHDSNNHVSDFVERANKSNAYLKECEDQVENQGETQITNVAATVFKIASDDRSLFSAKETESEVESLRLNAAQNGTGIDVFLALERIADATVKARGGDLAKEIASKEGIARYLFKDFAKVDKQLQIEKEALLA